MFRLLRCKAYNKQSGSVTVRSIHYGYFMLSNPSKKFNFFGGGADVLFI